MLLLVLSIFYFFNAFEKGQNKCGDELKEWSELDLQLRTLQTWLMNSRVAW